MEYLKMKEKLAETKSRMKDVSNILFTDINWYSF